MKYAYFQTETNKRLQSITTAEYDFGDERLLEGVKFIFTVLKDGTIKAETHPEDRDYMSNLNEAKILREAVEWIEDPDSEIWLGEETASLVTEGGKAIHWGGESVGVEAVKVIATPTSEIFGGRK